MKRIIYANDKGGVTILVPVMDCGLTIEQIAAKDVPQGKAYKIVDTSSISPDRYFRDAWKLNSEQSIEVDMPTAKEIAVKRLIAEREPLLTALDAEFMKALEAGDTEKQALIAAEKQRLRDITNIAALSDAKTPDDLKAVNCSNGVDLENLG